MARGGRTHLVATMLGLAVAAQAAVAAEALPPEKIKDAVAQRYGVEVLRITPTELDGQPAYAVVVMNPGGDFNTAFQVNTLMVDRASGEPIPQFRHRTTGYDLPGAADRNPPGDDVGTAIRRLTNRGR